MNILRQISNTNLLLPGAFPYEKKVKTGHRKIWGYSGMSKTALLNPTTDRIWYEANIIWGIVLIAIQPISAFK